MANRLAGHHDRGHDDFHTVPALHSAGSTECGRLVNRRLTCRFLEYGRFGIGLFHVLFLFFRHDKSCVEFTKLSAGLWDGVGVYNGYLRQSTTEAIQMQLRIFFHRHMADIRRAGHLNWHQILRSRELEGIS